MFSSLFFIIITFRPLYSAFFRYLFHGTIAEWIKIMVSKFGKIVIVSSIPGQSSTALDSVETG